MFRQNQSLTCGSYVMYSVVHHAPGRQKCRTDTSGLTTLINGKSQKCPKKTLVGYAKQYGTPQSLKAIHVGK